MAHKWCIGQVVKLGIWSRVEACAFISMRDPGKNGVQRTEGVEYVGHVVGVVLMSVKEMG